MALVHIKTKNHMFQTQKSFTFEKFFTSYTFHCGKQSKIDFLPYVTVLKRSGKNFNGRKKLLRLKNPFCCLVCTTNNVVALIIKVTELEKKNTERLDGIVSSRKNEFSRVCVRKEVKIILNTDTFWSLARTV